MDWWQRNKDFAVMVGAAIGLFLVLLIVRGCVYPMDVEKTTSKAKDTVSIAQRDKLPESQVLREINPRISDLEAAIKRDGEIIGETGKGDELTRSLLGSILERIGKGDSPTVDEFVRLARTSPNACFSRLYDDVRGFYADFAMDKDVPIDEALGFPEPRFGEDQITRAFHTLALVTRAVDIAVNDAKVRSIDKISVSFGRPKGRDRMERIVEKDYVTIVVRTLPDGVYRMLTSLNATGAGNRFIPIANFKVGGRGAKASAQGRQAETVIAEFTLTAVRIDLEPEEES